MHLMSRSINSPPSHNLKQSVNNIDRLIEKLEHCKMLAENLDEPKENRDQDIKNLLKDENMTLKNDKFEKLNCENELKIGKNEKIDEKVDAISTNVANLALKLAEMSQINEKIGATNDFGIDPKIWNDLNLAQCQNNSYKQKNSDQNFDQDKNLTVSDATINVTFSKKKISSEQQTLVNFGSDSNKNEQQVSSLFKNKPAQNLHNLAVEPTNANFEPKNSNFAPKNANCEQENQQIIDDNEILIVKYENERQISDIMRLITRDLSEPYSIYTYRYFIHNWPYLCFLAKAGDKYVGAIVCKLSLHDRGTRRGYIAMLAVDENYRRQKIGTRLVTQAIETMILEGCDEVVLETEVTNKSAMKLYENLGFVRDKRLFRYYLNGVDAFRLKLWLRPPELVQYL